MYDIAVKLSVTCQWHKSQNQSHRVNVNKRRPRWSGLSRMIHIQDECVRRFVLRIADILTNYHYASTDFGKYYAAWAN